MAARGAEAPAVQESELEAVNVELRRANERLERANDELARENARLARGLLGQSDAAAAAQILRAEGALRVEMNEAEARIARLELLLSTPRHRAVEDLRGWLRRHGVVHWLFRSARRMVSRGARG